MQENNCPWVWITVTTGSTAEHHTPSATVVTHNDKLWLLQAELCNRDYARQHCPSYENPRFLNYHLTIFGIIQVVCASLYTDDWLMVGTPWVAS